MIDDSKPQSNRPPRSRVSRQESRRGASLVLVLVVLLATSGIMLAVVSSSIRHRMQLRNESQLEQTLWLLDAGINATVKQMEDDPDFGQTELKLGETLPRYRGSIQAETISSDDDQWQIKVTAKLQGLNEHSPVTQRSRILIFDRGKK